jgi:hypothetical protein
MSNIRYAMTRSNLEPILASIFVINISNRSFFCSERKASGESVLEIAIKNGESRFALLSTLLTNL